MFGDERGCCFLVFSSFLEEELDEGLDFPAIPLFDLLLCLAEVVDLVSPRLFDHHLKVGYLAYRLGEAMGFPERGQEQLLFAGLIHDSGAFSLKERLEALEFEFSNLHYHAFVAHLLFKEFSFLPEISRILLFHHLPWEGGKGSYWQGDRVPLESHVLHFADRLSILFKADNEPLEEVRRVGEILREHVPEIFHPEVFEAFSSLLARDYVWFDFSSRDLHRIILENASPQKKCVNPSDFLALVKLVSHLIDFRSPFTVTHSAGVAQVALFCPNWLDWRKTNGFYSLGLPSCTIWESLLFRWRFWKKPDPLLRKNITL